MSIYETSMCCGAGVNGVGADIEPHRIKTVSCALSTNGVKVKRYDTSNSPQEFFKNDEINNLLDDKGADELPITVVDGKNSQNKGVSNKRGNCDMAKYPRRLSYRER